MVLTIRQLIDGLSGLNRKDDATASEALWIRFSEQQTKKAAEYRTADDNQIVHVYTDSDGKLVGIEIFS